MPTNTFPVPETNITGTVPTPTVTIDAATQSIAIQLVSSQWASKPGVAVSVQAQRSYDGGATWDNDWRWDTVSGALDRNGLLPSFRWTINDPARVTAALWRGQITTGAALRLGATITQTVLP